MPSEGDRAPAFELPGVRTDQFEQFRLTDATAAGNAVLILFYPFDFSPVCTAEVCAVRDAEWFKFTPDLSVWAVSGDSAHAHRAFATEHDLTFPLLSDTAGQVAESYGVLYDEVENHARVPKRAVVLVGPDRTIRYKWATDDTLVKPDFGPIKEAVDVLAEEREAGATADVELDLTYGET